MVRSHWREPASRFGPGTGLGAWRARSRPRRRSPTPKSPFSPVDSREPQGQLGLRQAGRPSVIAMEGRFHLYEGYSPWQVTFPIRVMKELGCRLLIVSNAAGGLNPLCNKGDLIVIEDHINLMGLNPLIGPNDDRLGPRFPDLIEPYDRELQNLALEVALEQNIVAHRGVYVAVVGPNLETALSTGSSAASGPTWWECQRFPRSWSRFMPGMKVLGFSIITDMCLADALQPVRIEEIIAVANDAEGKLRTVVRGVLERWNG